MTSDASRFQIAAINLPGRIDAVRQRVCKAGALIMWGYPSGQTGRAGLGFGSILLASTALTAAAPSVYAADTSQPALETVVVTAQKREENLQRVPVSVTALSNEKLTQLHATDFTQFAKFLPSVEYSSGGQGSSGGPGFANISMRGVNSGGDGNHSGSQPTVGVYLDEQPITTIGGTLDVPTYDVQRVEALSGPQGTLFGASSESGTIRIITNKPDPSGFEAGYDAKVNTLDHGGVGYTFEGFVNEPITDNIAIRLVGWDEQDAGYIDNVHGTRTYPTTGITIDNASEVRNNYNTVHKIGGRAALQIDLDQNWTITPTIMGQVEKTNGQFGFDASVGDLEVVHSYPEFAKDSWYQAALTVQGKIGNFDLVYSGGYMGRHVSSEADYTDYTFWYDTLAGYYVTDNAGNPVDSSQYIVGRDYFTKASNEVRISSPREDRFRWVFGLFQEQQTHYIEQDYKINALGSDFWVTGWPQTIWLTDERRIDNDYAVFGEVAYDILPGLTLTGGLRVFEDVNSLKGFYGFSAATSSHTGESQCFAPSVVDDSPCTNINKGVDDSGETHKVNLTWQVDPDRMIYATYSTGFRPGGVNRNGNLGPYDPDSLVNYEVGWKTSWDENRLRFNGALYWENWNNFQFSFLGPNSLTEIANAGAARVLGVESDIQWLIGDHLTLTGAGAFNDAQLTQAYCGAFNPDGTCSDLQAPNGTQLPITPRWKLNATGRYDFKILENIGAYLQTAVVYQSSSWNDLRVQAQSPLGGESQIRQLIGQNPGFATVDFSVGATYDNMTAELSIQNAFDERGQLYRYAECTTQVCGFQPYIIPTRPRMIELSIAQRF